MSHKLLIVEESAAVREILADLLGEAGFAVVTAEDGLAGLDRAWCDRPDLILTDIQLPHLDGIQMIRRLQQQPELQGIPVLVLSAVQKGTLRQAASAGAAEAPPKPLLIGNLIGLIRGVLSRAAARG